MKKQLLALTFGAMLSALCSPASAQQPGKIFRIGFLDPSNASGSVVLVDAFRQELIKLGWIAKYFGSAEKDSDILDLESKRATES